MGNETKYDRYAGIVSLPGADGKIPRPFRVDENGNVIYSDNETGAVASAEGRTPAQPASAGILDWDTLDRDAEKRLGRLRVPNAKPLAALPSLGEPPVTLSRKKIGGKDYHVISANSFDPARSNGKTAIPNADMIAAMNADKNQVTVTHGEKEKATRIVRLPFDFSAAASDEPRDQKNLPLTKPKSELYYTVPSVNAKARSTDRADTLQFARVPGTVAFGDGELKEIQKNLDLQQSLFLRKRP